MSLRRALNWVAVHWDRERTIYFAEKVDLAVWIKSDLFLYKKNIKKANEGKKIKFISSYSFKTSQKGSKQIFWQKKFSFRRGDDDKQEVRDNKIPQQKLNFSVYFSVVRKQQKKARKQNIQH